MKRRIFVLWLSSVFATFLFVACLFGYGLLKLLPAYQVSIENRLSLVTGFNISLKVKYDRFHGINPIIEVSQITVKDKGFLLNIPKITVQINTWQSFLSWKFLTKKVLVEKPKLSFYSNGLDDHFVQSLSVNEMNKAGGCFSRILAYLLQQNSLKLLDMQVDVVSYIGAPVEQINVNADYQRINRDKGILYLNFQPNIEMKTIMQIDIVSVIEKKGGNYYFDTTLHDKRDMLATMINGVTQQIKISPLVDHQLALSIVTTPTHLDSVTVVGGLSQVEFKTNFLEKLVFNNIMFNLRVFRYEDRFFLDTNPLYFIVNDKSYKFRSVLCSLDQGLFVVDITRLNLADLSSFLRLESSDWRKSIVLSGVISDARFSFDVQSFDLNSMSLVANFNNLGITNSNQNFDFEGFSGKLCWGKSDVKLIIDSPSFNMGDNYLFSRKWPALSAKGNIKIIRQPSMVGLIIDEFTLVNPHVNFSAKGSVCIPTSDPKNFFLDINSKFHGHNLTTEYQSFLPQTVIPARLYEWLMECLYDVKSLNATIKIKGFVREIPYPKNNGILKIDADIQGASLSPYFGWGVANQVDGSLHLQNELLHARVHSGWLANIPIMKFDLSVHNIGSNVPATFSISTNFKSNSQNIYAYLHQTKYQSLIEKISEYAIYQDDISTELDLLIVLGDESKKNKVSGEILVNHGILNIKKPFVKNLYDVSSKITFMNEHIILKQLSAFWDVNAALNLQGSINLGNLEDPKINLQGNLLIPLTAKLGIDSINIIINELIQGVLPLQFTIKGQLSNGSVNVNSSFLGTTIRLGAPLNKMGFELTPIVLKSRWQQEALNINKEGAQLQAPRSYWHIYSTLDINKKSTISGDFNVNGKGKITNLSLYGQIESLSSQLILNLISGFKLSKILVLTDQEWQPEIKLDSSFIDKQDSVNGCFVFANFNNCIYRNLHQLLKPKVMFGVDNFNIFGTDYYKFKLETTTEHQSIKYAATADQNKSLVVSISDSICKPIEVFSENLSFSLNTSIGNSQNNVQYNMLNSLLQVDFLRKLPDMNIKLSNVQLNSYSVPDFLMAISLKGGIFSIPVLSVNGSNVKLLSTIVLSPHVSYLYSNIFSLDWGNMLHNFGYDNFFKGGSGNFELQLYWPGLLPILTNISGKATADIINGVVLSVESGVAKYIGLLSLDAYFKRLFMSYNDFENRGMLFNSIVGTYIFKNGIAKSKPSIIIDTPSFTLVIISEVNLISKQLSQRIKYQPHFSGTTAAVAGAIGGPVVAFATYLGTKLLGNTVFKNIGLVSFDVTGVWDKLELKQV